MGERARARTALADLMDARPTFTMDYVDWLPFTDRAWNEHFKQGLAMAAGAGDPAAA